MYVYIYAHMSPKKSRTGPTCETVCTLFDTSSTHTPSSVWIVRNTEPMLPRCMNSATHRGFEVGGNLLP